MKLCTALMGFIKLKDQQTYIHSYNVALLCQKIAAKLSLKQDKRNLLFMGAMLHDIGKLGVDERILHTTLPLSVKDYDEIKKHPAIGRELLNGFPELKDVALIVGCHHERVDGSGYPAGLSGEDIPLESRIIAVADSYDAMLSRRYEHHTPPSAIREIKRCLGTQFDAEIADSFIHVVE